MTFPEGRVAQTASAIHRRDNPSADTGFGKFTFALEAHSERSSFKR
jgi:hypothetical protein